MSLKYQFCILVVSLLQVSQGQLIVKPSEPIVSRDQFTPFIALCTGHRNTRVVKWQSPFQTDVDERDHSRITVERPTSGLRLRIKNLTQSDQGRWTCLGSNANGEAFSTSLELSVKVPITFLGPSTQYVELNSGALIPCQARASSSAEVSWFKGADKASLSLPNYEPRFDGLRIQRVSLSDDDTFWCRADVSETGESKDYPIQVILVQSISSPRIVCADPCAVEKQTATLICEAHGRPELKYSWFYGESNADLASGTPKFAVRGNRLTIRFVDETDNGRYACHASNEYDRRGQRVEYDLRVIIPPLLSSIPPTEINLDDSYPSQRAVFTCHLERGSFEELSLTWLHSDNRPVQAINGILIETSRFQTNHYIDLHFDPVRREHHGNYTCQAKNRAGSISVVAQLLVRYKPIFLGPQTSDVFSVVHHRTILQCHFDSSPPARIEWTKRDRRANEYDEGQRIALDSDPQVIDVQSKQTGSTFVASELTYNVSEADFASQFECRAMNPRLERHSFNLRRAEPPDPVRVSNVQLYASAIDLNLQSTSNTANLPPLRYIVKYDQTDVSDSLKTLAFPVTPNESQILRLESLQPATSYRIQVATESSAGRSPFSIPIQVKTSAGEVPQFNFSSHSTSCGSDTSCSIGWSVEALGDSPISRIEISFAKIRNGQRPTEWSKPIILRPQASEYELKGLKADTNYLIAVRVFNLAGVTERRIQKTTTKFCSNPSPSPTCRTGCCRNPNKWIIAGIVVAIITSTIVFFSLLILIQVLCESTASRTASPEHDPMSADA